jgi:hypothetical protein
VDHVAVIVVVTDQSESGLIAAAIDAVRENDGPHRVETASTLDVPLVTTPRWHGVVGIIVDAHMAQVPELDDFSAPAQQCELLLVSRRPLSRPLSLRRVDFNFTHVDLSHRLGLEAVRTWTGDVLARSSGHRVDGTGDYATVEDLRVVETLIFEVNIALDTSAIDLPTPLLVELENLITLLEHHVRSPRPRRPILRVIVDQLGSFAMGVASGATGNAIWSHGAMQEAFERAVRALGL